MGNQIFISYLREDGRAWAGHLYDQLVDHLGHDCVFMDVDTLQRGLDYVQTTEAAISETVALLVVIGPDWLDAWKKINVTE